MPKRNPTPFEMVGEFHETFGHPVHTKPVVPAVERQRLRALLMIEELAEIIETLYDGAPRAEYLETAVQRIRGAGVMVEKAEDYEFKPDIVKLAKELTDSLYVTNGTGHEFGLNLDLASSETHRSNMSKLDPETGKPIYSETGKVLKGANYSEADMRAVIDFDEVEAKKESAA